MVRLEEVEDETFVFKPEGTKDNAILADDDEDYTDTDSEISDSSDLEGDADETLYERIAALKDIVPPKTRARISNVSSSIFSTASSTLTFGGKSIWVLATSVLLLGVPYALALGEEQQLMEEERQRGMMAEGAQSMISDEGEAKASL